MKKLEQLMRLLLVIETVGFFILAIRYLFFIDELPLNDVRILGVMMGALGVRRVLTRIKIN